jgi:hypothetical protein
MCSWCKRVRQEGRWLDLEEGVQELELLSRGPLPEISHGMCPACIEAYYPVAGMPVDEGEPESPPKPAAALDNSDVDLSSERQTV